MSECPTAIPFGSLTAEHHPQVGGKCASLGTMSQAGLPVPPGFAVTTRVFVDAAGDANARAQRPSGPHPTDHETRLVALEAWYEEWATVARAVVTREDHLVRLGLASPRSPSSG